MNEELMLSSDLEDRPTGVFSFIQNMPSSVQNIDHLIEMMTSFEVGLNNK